MCLLKLVSDAPATVEQLKLDSACAKRCNEHCKADNLDIVQLGRQTRDIMLGKEQATHRYSPEVQAILKTESSRR